MIKVILSGDDGIIYKNVAHSITFFDFDGALQISIVFDDLDMDGNTNSANHIYLDFGDTVLGYKIAHMRIKDHTNLNGDLRWKGVMIYTYKTKNDK